MATEADTGGAPLLPKRQRLSSQFYFKMVSIRIVCKKKIKIYNIQSFLNANLSIIVFFLNQLNWGALYNLV